MLIDFFKLSDTNIKFSTLKNSLNILNLMSRLFNKSEKLPNM